MSLIIGSTGARQLPAELVNKSIVKHIENKPTESPLAGVVGEKAVFCGDIDRVRKDAQQAIQDGKARPINFDTVEISGEAKAAVNKQELSAVKLGLVSADDPVAEKLSEFVDFIRDYDAKRKNGTLTADEVLPDAVERLQNRKPQVATQRAGETDDAFMRRKIGCDVSNAWADHLLKTLTTTENMPMGEALRYQREKSVEWATNLMKNEPAMFREWLEREAWHIERGDGNAIIPTGFTVADYNQWMSKDVLDYFD